jgi:hypothetical protein
MRNREHVSFIQTVQSFMKHAAAKLLPQRVVVLLIGVISLSVPAISGKTLNSFPPPDTASGIGAETYDDTLQHHYVELIRIIGISTDSVINHIHELDNRYSGKLAEIYDSLSLVLPVNKKVKSRDSLSTIYIRFLQTTTQNRQMWSETVRNFRASVLRRLDSEKIKFACGDCASNEDYSFGISLFDNYCDSVYQFVKDTIADCSDNAAASINNLFVTLRDSLQILTGSFLQSSGEEFIYPDIKNPAEAAAGKQSESPAPTRSPYSLYANISRRYDRNPLYNYQKVGDWLWQSYHELRYLKAFASDVLSVKYTGSMNLFNDLEQRNYYENLLTGKYRFIFGQHESPITDDASDDSFEKFTSLNISVSAGARFDKKYYHDYNNFGTTLTASYKNPLNDSLFVFIKNIISSREYGVSSELSNAMELLSAGIAGMFDGNVTYGVSLQGGVKQYYQTLTDSVVDNSTVVSVVTQPVRTYHSAINFRLLKNWETSSAQFTFAYSTNFNSKARFIRKNIDMPFLNEDMYYDFFSYTGEDARIELQRQIPYNIRMNLSMEFHSLKLYLPAYNLSGIQTAENRHDVVSGLALTFARYFDSGLGFGYEANISGGLLRHKSNDDYNDYSTYFVAAGASIGF